MLYCALIQETRVISGMLTNDSQRKVYLALKPRPGAAGRIRSALWYSPPPGSNPSGSRRPASE